MDSVAHVESEVVKEPKAGQLTSQRNRPGPAGKRRSAPDDIIFDSSEERSVVKPSTTSTKRQKIACPPTLAKSVKV